MALSEIDRVRPADPLVPEELAESERRLRSLLEHVSDVITVLDREGNFLYTSPSVEWLLGHELGACDNAFTLVHPDDAERALAAFREALAHPGVSGPWRLQVAHADGSWRHVEVVANNLLGDPVVGGIVLTVRDVTDQQRAERLDAAQAEVLEHALRGSPLGTILTGLAQMAADGGGAARAAVVLAAPPGEDIVCAVGPAPGPGERRTTLSAPITGAGGGVLGHVEVSAPAAGRLEADVPRLQRVARLAALVVEHGRAGATIAHQATHDRLTGLPNRALLADRLESALARLDRRAGRVAVLAVDIDRFGQLNDTLGHAAGDELLRAVAERMARVLRPQDTLARAGSDEFFVVSEGLQRLHEVTGLAERLAGAVAAPVRVAGHELFCTVSIGVGTTTDRDESAEALLQRATTATARAKRRGGASIEVYDELDRQRLLERVEIESALHRALPRRELRLYHQPVVDLGTGRIAGVEALVRWRHPTRGMLAPEAFVPVAEEIGLIVPIGAWVLDEACRDLAGWRGAGLVGPEFALSVNLSARQLAAPGLLEAIGEALERNGIDAASLCLEITESMAIADLDASVAALSAIRDMGVRVALDDFGTGHASLANLHRLPVDELKIDRSFVGGLRAAPAAPRSGPAAGGGAAPPESLPATIVALARALGLGTVAEGVEHPGALEALRELGCQRAQGFLFGEPAPAAALAGLLAADPRW